MVHELKILRLRYSNIRDFKDLDVDFLRSKGKPYRVSLVQMPNGTGKTTTIHLLRKLLYGGTLSEEEVRSFKPAKFKAKGGKFEVDLSFDGSPFTLRMNLDYDAGTFSYENSKPGVQAGGLEKGHWLPEQIRYVIKESFTSLFVFDGELSKKLLDKRTTKADEAIRSIYFLDQLVSQKDQIDERREEKRSKAKLSEASTDQGLSNLRTQQRNMKQTLTEMIARKIDLEQQTESLQSDIAAKHKQHDDIIASREDVLVQVQAAEAKISECKKDIHNQTVALLTQMRRPGTLSPRLREGLDNLFSRMNVLKLPKATSTEFFRGLAEQRLCICGRELDAVTRQAILDNSARYLSEEDIAILNAMKDHLRSLPPLEAADSRLEALAQLEVNLRLAQQLKDSLTTQLDPKAQAEAKRLTKDIGDRQSKLDEVKREHFLLTTANPTDQLEYEVDWRVNIPKCEARVAEFDEKIAEVTGTVDFENKAKLLDKMIDAVVATGLESIKQSLIGQTNDRLTKILHSSEVQIAGIENSIQIAKKGNVSEGQSLSVAYAFLSVLFEHSPYKVPFVVDSPAVSIDLEVRREVSDIIPSLFNQMIVFIISSEREGFVDGLEKVGDVQYYTIYKDQKKGKGGEVRLSKDRTLFMDFQSDENGGD